MANVGNTLATLDKTVEIISDAAAPVVNPLLNSLKQEGEELVTRTWRQLLTPELIPVNEGPVSQGDLQEGEFLTLAGKKQEQRTKNLASNKLFRRI